MDEVGYLVSLRYSKRNRHRRWKDLNHVEYEQEFKYTGDNLINKHLLFTIDKKIK